MRVLWSAAWTMDELSALLAAESVAGGGGGRGTWGGGRRDAWDSGRVGQAGGWLVPFGRRGIGPERRKRIRLWRWLGTRIALGA